VRRLHWLEEFALDRGDAWLSLWGRPVVEINGVRYLDDGIDRTGASGSPRNDDRDVARPLAPPETAVDRQTGISIRLIREFDIERDSYASKWDVVMNYSCALLGHSWLYNPDDRECQICGRPRPDVDHDLHRFHDDGGPPHDKAEA
jgi:hypothetical protein